MADRFEHLWRPGVIGTLRLPHRIVMGAMHLGREADDDGGAALAAFYAERAAGGAGLMVTGGAAISAAGAGGRRYGVLTDGRFRDRLARVTDTVHAAGGLIALQLFHAGRYAPPGPHGPVAPSAVFSRISGAEPRPLSAGEIAATLDDYARAGGYAATLGFDAVEIMASEGYLIDQFLSPLTNLRDDRWGGDPERRARFGIAVTRRVRDAVGGGFPLIVRMTGDDLMPGGVPREHALEFARQLAAAGADALNVGVGWHESPVPTVQAVVPPGRWAPVAAAVTRAVADRPGAPRPVPVMASNRINRPEIAEAVLAAGQADYVSLARPLLADPQFVERARRGRPINVCIGCNQACIDRSLVDEGPTVSCLVNPRAGRELEWPRSPHPPSSPGDLGGPHAPGASVAVIGGGPAGLYAARDLAAAGHHVTLFEAEPQVGGQFRLAARVPGKADYGATVDYLAAELAAHHGCIEVGRPVTAADEELLAGFDGVIVATGVRPRALDIPGADLPHVLTYQQAFTRDVTGRMVIIGGGGIAVDLAHYGSSPPPRSDDAPTGVTPTGVSLLHRGPRVGARIGRSTRWAVLGELRAHGVQLCTNTRCQQITAEGVHTVDADGRRDLVPADTVAVAIGQQSHDPISALLRRTGRWHRVVGGARDAVGLDAVRAIAEAQRAAAEFTAAVAERRTMDHDGA